MRKFVPFVLCGRPLISTVAQRAPSSTSATEGKGSSTLPSEHVTSPSAASTTRTAATAGFLEREEGRPHRPNQQFPPTDPLARMHRVMQTDRAAVGLHRELMLCLATGDAEGSATVARLLAERIKGKDTSSKATDQGDSKDPSPSPTAAAAEIPLTESAIEGISAKFAEGPPSTTKGTITSTTTDASDLTVTIVDAVFEMEDDDEQVDEASRITREDLANKTLAKYLEEDESAWQSQKALIAKVVLEAAQSISAVRQRLPRCNDDAFSFRVDGSDDDGSEGVSSSSEILQGEESSSVPSSFNPFTECNVVIRAEVPPVPQASGTTPSPPSSTAFEAEVRRIKAQFRPSEWTPEAEDLVRTEVHLALTSVRYKVGVHHSLETALGNKITAAFVDAAMRKLNNDPTLAIPATPATYMLRLCLWYGTEDAAATATRTPAAHF